MTQVAGTIEVNHAGTVYRASYSVKGGKVHILTPLGSKAPKPLGNSEAEEVARLMVKELLHERDNQMDAGQAAERLMVSKLHALIGLTLIAICIATIVVVYS